MSTPMFHRAPAYFADDRGAGQGTTKRAASGRKIIAVVTLMAATFCAHPQSPDAGFLFDEFQLTLKQGDRTEAAGPFYYREHFGPEDTLAVPPLFSRVADPETDLYEFDFLYPILTYNRFGTEYRWQLGQLISFAGGESQEQDAARRFTLFPLYFQQRSADTNRNYTALFPFYGRLKNRVLRDEIFFVMFPIYSQTRKGNVVTDNFLYPIFHDRSGPALSGWQAWPFVGFEHKDVTTRTNGFGDVEVVPGHDRRFIMWPIHLRQESGIGTDNPVEQWAVLPLYSSYRSPQRDSTTVIWPLFTRVDDRAKGYEEWQMPWPIIVFARGPGKQTSRIWPLFSDARSTNLESRFFLWPIYRFTRFHTESVDRERTRILFFLYSDMSQANLETGKARRRVDLWPLFTHSKDYNGNRRLQVFALLEPLLPNSTSVERNYSHIWSLWRSEHNPETGAASQSLLWNLYRRETHPESRKCSLLFGLFQYESDSDTKRWRLFYLPALRKRNTPTELSDG